MFVYTESMNTNEHIPYDIVLLPTYAGALSYRKRVAAEGGPRALFGVTVTTFSAWIADWWELFGDGRVLASALEVEALSAALCSKYLDDAQYAHVVATCLQKGAGIPSFDGACSLAKRDEDCGLSLAQSRALRLCAEVRDELRDLGRALKGEVLFLLPGVLPQRPLRVLVENAAPLTEQERAFFDACPFIDCEIHEAPGGEGVRCVADGISVRFAFPSGRYAEPAILRDALCAKGHSGAIVACKDPLSLFEKLASVLAEAGLSCAARASVPFARTDFGAAMLALRSFLTSEAWLSSDLTDFLLSPFSGLSIEGAYSVDAQVRGNRLLDRETIVSVLRERSRLFEAMEDIATDRDADILLGELEDAVRSMVHRPEAWRREQLAAMSALRDAAAAARLADLDMQGLIALLGRSSVDASRSLGVAADGESCGSNLSVLPADIVFIDYSRAAAFPPASCGLAVACDLTSAAFPASDSDNAASTLLAKLGIHQADDALSRMRRSFVALSSAPRETFLIVRCLNDEDADPTYPAAVLEEFVDCYREDPSATDDIKNAFMLPACLQEGIIERGEESLVENAVLTDGDLPHETVKLPAPGEVSAAKRSLVVLPRVVKGQVIDEPCLSPSQIESYLECPYKWFAQRRLRLEGLDEGFGALQMGDFAHGVLKSFYAHFQDEVAPKVTLETLEPARAIMRDILARHESRQVELKPTDNRLVPTTELERREMESLKRKLLDYLDYEAALLPTFHPTYLEYGIAEGDAVEYAGHMLVGTADRIDIDDAGRAVVLDYKASISPEHELAVREEGRLGKVQALIYAQVVRRTLGLNPVGALYVRYGKRCAVTGAYDAAALEAPHLPFMRHEKCEVVPENGQSFADLLDQTEEEVARGVERMLSGDVRPNPASPHACAWCPVISCAERRA